MKIIPLFSENRLDKTLKYSKEEFIYFANLRISINQIEDAINDCEKAIFLDEYYLEAYFLRFLLYIKIKSFSNAVEDMIKAIDIEKKLTNNNTKSYEIFMSSYYEMGQEYKELIEIELKKRSKK